MLNCPYCKFNIKDYSKYCSHCGKQLKKTCSKCNLNFNVCYNFCDHCGSKLKNESSKPEEAKSSLPINEDNCEVKLKVGVTHGLNLETVKQEFGGGNRYLYLYKRDNYYTVLKKLTGLYFPRNQTTCLGNVNEFEINLLDFKKQVLDKSNFTIFANYVKNNGLTLNIRPIFFLHLNRINKFEKFSSVKAQNSSQITTQKTYTQNSGQLVPSLSPLSTVSNQIKSTSSSIHSLRTKSHEINKNNSNSTYEPAQKLPNKRERSSSSSSISSSSSTASWKCSKKLDKKLNNRIENLKKETKVQINDELVYKPPANFDKKTSNQSENQKEKKTLLPLPKPIEIKQEKTDEIILVDKNQDKTIHKDDKKQPDKQESYYKNSYRYYNDYNDKNYYNSNYSLRYYINKTGFSNNYYKQNYSYNDNNYKTNYNYKSKNSESYSSYKSYNRNYEKN